MPLNRGLLLHRYSPPLYKIYSSWRGKKLESRIRAEQTEYLSRAHGTEQPAEPAIRLRKRLAGRGIEIRETPRPHVVYATRPSNWEPHNIPPELEKVARLTPYYYSARGFDDTSSDWLSRRGGMDADLVSFIRELHAREPVDLLLAYMSGWQVSPETIRAICDMGIITAAYHWDDKLSFRGEMAGGRWSGPAAVAAAYDANLTNAPSSLVKYEVEGGIAFFWPEGANPEQFRALGLPYEYDVSFVGACYGFRPVLIDYLRRNGIDAAAFGPGWPSGAISESSMVELYAKSRINVGFGGIGYSRAATCLKGRDFEVPMSGALYLTSSNPELDLVFEVGREIATYRDADDCLKQIRSLLAVPERAEAMRVAARNRCVADHTWARRFEQLFEWIGFRRAPSTDRTLERAPLP
jgi:hypothetical protein